MITTALISYIFSLSITVLTILSGVFVVFYPPFILRTFPRALKLYVTVCYIPLILLTAFITIYCSIVSLIYSSERLSIVMSLNTINSYIIQTTRTFFFTVALERIIATAYIEKYNFSNKLWWFFVLTISTITSSIGFVALVLNIFDGLDLTFLLYRYTTLSMHLTSIAVTGILYTMNQRLYKITAYRISLKKRYQIAENVKILSNIFPLMLIYNLISPAGTVITLISFHTPLPTLPNSVIYLFQNLPHLIIFLRIIYVNRKRMRELNTIDSERAAVRTIMGKNLAVVINADDYFKGLQQQWK